MYPLLAALGRRCLPRLAISGRPDGLRSWLAEGNYYVDVSSNPDKVTLTNIALTDVLPFYAFDYQRFAFCSLESLVLAKPDHAYPNALGWPLIKLYYSAFFAGHAIMRAIGRGVIRVESPQASKLSAIGKILCGANFSITTGTYGFGVTQAADQSLSITLTKCNSSGPAHEIFWRQFYELLAMVAQEIANSNEPAATDATSKIEEIRDILGAKGSFGGHWLSAIRNEINYQHHFDVWFPSRTERTVAQHLRNIAYKDSSAIRLDYNSYKEPLKAFSNGSLVLSALNCELCGFLVERTATSSVFSRQWRQLMARAS